MLVQRHLLFSRNQLTWKFCRHPASQTCPMNANDLKWRCEVTRHVTTCLCLMDARKAATLSFSALILLPDLLDRKLNHCKSRGGEDSEDLGQHDTEEICSVQVGASLKWDPHATWPPLQVLYELWTCMSQLSEATSAFSIHALAFFFHLGLRNKRSLSLHKANESNKCIQMPNTSTFRPELENEWKRKNFCTCSTRHVESQILQKDDTAGSGICAGRLSKWYQTYKIIHAYKCCIFSSSISFDAHIMLGRHIHIYIFCICVRIYTLTLISFEKCVAHLLARADGTSTSGPTQSLQKVTGLPSFSY